MNKTERKNKLSEFMDKITECVTDLEGAKVKASNLVSKIDELNLMTDDYSLGENLFDNDKMQSIIINALIDNTEFHEISGEISEFKADLDQYIIDLPEEKSDELDDFYSDWDSLSSVFEFSEEDVIDDVIANLERALQLIEERIKEKKY